MSLQLGLINPAVPGEITQAGMLVCVSDAHSTYYPTASKPSTGAIATGFRQVGILSDLPNIEAGRETETVGTGIYNLAQEVLFKSMTGKVSFKLYGVDPGALALGLNVTPVVTGASPMTATASATDSGTGFTTVTITSPTCVAGDTVQVCAAGATAYSTNLARVLSVSGSTVVLDRLLREAPGTTPTVSKVTNIMLPIGGTAPKYFSFAGITDFPDGRVALIAFPKVYSTKTLSFGFGNGQKAVEIPIELEALGALDATYGVILGKIFIFPPS